MTLILSGNDSCLARNLKGRFGLNQIGWRDVKSLMQIPHIGIQVILIPETREEQGHQRHTRNSSQSTRERSGKNGLKVSSGDSSTNYFINWIDFVAWSMAMFQASCMSLDHVSVSIRN